MQTFLYSVFDNKALTFCRPFVAVNDATAIRDFYAAATSDTDIGRFPNDFCLYRLASFQDVSGLIVPEPTLVNLGLASLAYESSNPRLKEMLNGQSPVVTSTPPTSEV